MRKTYSLGRWAGLFRVSSFVSPSSGRVVVARVANSHEGAAVLYWKDEILQSYNPISNSPSNKEDRANDIILVQTPL
jgi:hypothetical protein